MRSRAGWCEMRDGCEPALAGEWTPRHGAGHATAPGSLHVPADRGNDGRLRRHRSAVIASRIGRVARSKQPCPRHATCRTARAIEPRLDDAGTGEHRTQSFRRSAVMMLRTHVVITNEMRLIRQ